MLDFLMIRNLLREKGGGNLGEETAEGKSQGKDRGCGFKEGKFTEAGAGERDQRLI